MDTGGKEVHGGAELELGGDTPELAGTVLQYVDCDGERQNTTTSSQELSFGAYRRQSDSRRASATEGAAEKLGSSTGSGSGDQTVRMMAACDPVGDCEARRRLDGGKAAWGWRSAEGSQAAAR